MIFQASSNFRDLTNCEFKNRYIVTGLTSGMMLINQQRAHKRILFDQYLRQLDSHKALSQQLLFPEILELTRDDMYYFEHMLPDLQRVGFEFEITAPTTFSVKGMPEQLSVGSVIDTLLEMLDKTKSTAEDLAANMHSTIALSLADAASIKSGQQLTQEEMTDIIDRLFACENHQFTPDGKKIITIITSDEIEKRF